MNISPSIGSFFIYWISYYDLMVIENLPWDLKEYPTFDPNNGRRYCPHQKRQDYKMTKPHTLDDFVYGDKYICCMFCLCYDGMKEKTPDQAQLIRTDKSPLRGNALLKISVVVYMILFIIIGSIFLAIKKIILDFILIPLVYIYRGLLKHLVFLNHKEDLPQKERRMA